MTIDEAIAEEKELYEITKDRYEKLNVKNCKDRAEEHKQMIEWLEELKTIRQWKSDVMEDFCRYDVNSFDELVANVRAKTIDEFAKQLKEKAEEMVQSDLGGMYEMSYERAYNNALFEMEDVVDEIAKQLKIGGAV